VCVVSKVIVKELMEKIIWNIPAYISPIRLRDIAGDLAGRVLRVSGWGRIYDCKYKYFIIIL
jgi:hypothetical protein